MTLIQQFISYLGEHIGDAYVWGARGQCLDDLNIAKFVKNSETSTENYERAFIVHLINVPVNFNNNPSNISVEHSLKKSEQLLVVIIGYILGVGNLLFIYISVDQTPIHVVS